MPLAGSKLDVSSDIQCEDSSIIFQCILAHSARFLWGFTSWSLK